MYFEQSLVSEHHRERLRKAQENRVSYRLAGLRKARRRQDRAERDLLSAWERAERLRSALASG